MKWQLNYTDFSACVSGFKEDEGWKLYTNLIVSIAFVQFVFNVIAQWTISRIKEILNEILPL